MLGGEDGFREFDRQFDAQFRKTRQLAVIGMFFSMCISVSVLVFIGWAIVKIMGHYGII